MTEKEQKKRCYSCINKGCGFINNKMTFYCLDKKVKKEMKKVGADDVLPDCAFYVAEHD